MLALSEYKPTAWFGGLLALTMIVAFLAEVFILPATIMMMPRLFGATRARGRRPGAPRTMIWLGWRLFWLQSPRNRPLRRRRGNAGGRRAHHFVRRRRLAFGRSLPAMDAAEFGPQLMLDVRGAFAGMRFRYRAEGIVEGLLAAIEATNVTGAIARVRDRWIETGGGKADLRVGYGRVIWGRLDEIQPSDVINPLDAARFFSMAAARPGCRWRSSGAGCSRGRG